MRFEAHDTKEARVISVSIVALSMLWNVSGPASGSVKNGDWAVVPSVALPHVPLPRVRLPHLPKRGSSNDALAQTERRLKAMVADQEAWYSDHGRYGTNPNAVARNTTRADSAFGTVQVQVLYAGKKGWTAMASHPDAPGKTCVIYVGYRNALPMVPRTRADATDASSEAKPACDR